jgi:hypothetical protein
MRRHARAPGVQWQQIAADAEPLEEIRSRLEGGRLLNANRSRFEVTATWAFEGIEVVIGLIRPFNSDQAIRHVATWAWRQRRGFRFRFVGHLAF